MKREWTLTSGDREVVNQAYSYALDTGAPCVLVTNGDYYAVFDRRLGLSRDENRLGDFRLTALRETDLELINLLRKGNLDRG